MRISDWSSDVCSSDLESDRHEEALVIVLVDEHVVIGRRAHLVAPHLMGAHRLVLADVEERRVAGPGAAIGGLGDEVGQRSEEHTSELQSLMRISYAVFCLKKKTYNIEQNTNKLDN